MENHKKKINKKSTRFSAAIVQALSRFRVKCTNRIKTTNEKLFQTTDQWQCGFPRFIYIKRQLSEASFEGYSAFNSWTYSFVKIAFVFCPHEPLPAHFVAAHRCSARFWFYFPLFCAKNGWIRICAVCIGQYMHIDTHTFIVGGCQSCRMEHPLHERSIDATELPSFNNIFFFAEKAHESRHKNKLFFHDGAVTAIIRSVRECMPNTERSYQCADSITTPWPKWIEWRMWKRFHIKMRHHRIGIFIILWFEDLLAIYYYIDEEWRANHVHFGWTPSISLASILCGSSRSHRVHNVY